MNAKELKTILKSLPDDTEIYIDSKEPGIDGNIWAFKVHKAIHSAVKRVKDNKVVQRPCKETSGCKRGLVLFYD